MTKTDGTRLCDENAEGKERPWRKKKLANISYFELLNILEFKKAQRVSTCGEILNFDMTVDGRMKLASAWFCKSVLCPMCNWRKSMKRSVQATKIVKEVIKEKPKSRWLFLTLTVRNVFSGSQLDSSLKEVSIGFNRLVKYKKVKKNLIGYMKTTEVTVNNADHSYNQHLHVLLCVSSTYFKDDSNYIKQSEWAELWQKAMKLSYIPVVHIESVKEKKTGIIGSDFSIASAVKETAKYSVKDADYLTGNLDRDLEVVKDLEKGLNRKRTISYGGLFKEVHRKMNLDTEEDSDLVVIDPESVVDEKAYSIVAKWNWRLKDYFI